MTSWIPKLAKGTGPLYVQLADKIENDIAAGVLKAGDKLPPQRNLSFDIGVTIGTVGRAYQLAIERGLVSAEVGRGTFVLEANDNSELADFHDVDNVVSPIIRGMEVGAGLHRMNTTSAPDVGQSAVIERLLGEILQDSPALAIDYIRRLYPSWLQAGKAWLSTGDWSPSQDCIVPTQGVHAGLMSTIASVTQPGDKVAFENVTYASLSRALSRIGRRVVSVNMGPDGIIPEDFESVCAQQHPKVLVTIPTLHNPTATIMPEENRKKIADIAKRHQVLIMEDNIYGKLLEKDVPPPIAAFAPDITFHLGGLSKSIAAGVRAGWIACPAHFRNRVMGSNRALTGGHSYMLTELSARLINSGLAVEYCEKIKLFIARREKMVRKIFADQEFSSHPNLPYFWLKLKEPWLSETFKSTVQRYGMLLDVAEEFKAGQCGAAAPHRVRVAFVWPSEDIELQRCLTLLRDLMDSTPGGYDDYS